MQRVINRNTRLLSMLLCIMMVMSMMPSKAFAETSDAAATKDTVTVSVMGYDKVIASAAEVPIKAFDIAKYTGGTTPEKFTALHAVIYALNNGTSLDLNNQSDFKCVGGYISTIDGLSEFDKGKMSGWMYAVNGIKPDKGLSMCDIKAGDNIVLYYSSSMTQTFAYFTEPVKTVNKDTLFTMTLMGNSGDLGDNSKIKPMSGVAVCGNGKPLEYNTDYDGRVIIKLSEPGEYRITTQQA
mgnify:FL=1